MKDLNSIKGKLKKLFDSQRLAVLGTQREGQPYTSLVAFASSEDLKSLFFATTRSTRKYAYLSADSRVSMLVDNRSNEAFDFREAMAATALGEAEEMEGQDREKHLDLYLRKHPHLEEFVSSPSCAFIKIRVDRYYIVSRFQNVMEIHVEK